MAIPTLGNGIKVVLMATAVFMINLVPFTRGVGQIINTRVKA